MCEGDQVISLLSMARAMAAMDPQNSLLSILRAHVDDILKAVLCCVVHVLFTNTQTESIVSDNLQCVISSRLISPTDGLGDSTDSGSLCNGASYVWLNGTRFRATEIKRKLITHCRLSMARDFHWSCRFLAPLQHFDAHLVADAQ